MRTAITASLAGLGVLAVAASCGVGTTVSTSGSAASQGSGASSGSMPGSGGGSGDDGGLCGSGAIQGTIIPNIEGPGQCGVVGAVEVHSVSGVELSPPATVTCETAQALNTWVSGSVKPKFSSTGNDLAEIEVAAHYACRSRNGQPGTQLSEHAFGRAIDISGFRLADGEMVSVRGGWSSSGYGALLKDIHRAACGRFMTTLGPGSDGYHEAHLHYDLGTPGEPEYCR